MYILYLCNVDLSALNVVWKQCAYTPVSRAFVVWNRHLVYSGTIKSQPIYAHAHMMHARLCNARAETLAHLYIYNVWDRCMHEKGPSAILISVKERRMQMNCITPWWNLKKKIFKALCCRLNFAATSHIIIVVKVHGYKTRKDRPYQRTYICKIYEMLLIVYHSIKVMRISFVFKLNDI